MKRFGRKGLILVFGVGVAALAITAGALASTKKKSASVQVCVLLPDTKSSVRWVQFDKPLLTKAFKKAGVSASINNALNDPTKQKAQAIWQCPLMRTSERARPSFSLSKSETFL